MSITYRILANAAYYKTLMDRYDQQRPRHLRYSTQYGIAGLIFAAIWALMTRPLTQQVIFQSFAIGALVAIGGAFITKIGIVWRFSRRADFGQEHEVVISEEGVAAVGTHVESKWSWPAYPRSVRFSDGILLMRKGVIRWLPDTAIVIGDATAATAMVESKTTLRRP